MRLMLSQWRQLDAMVSYVSTLSVLMVGSTYFPLRCWYQLPEDTVSLTTRLGRKKLLICYSVVLYVVAI